MTENMPRITVSIVEDRHQLKAHNFETAQHADKRILDVSSTINALQTISNWGPSPQGIFFLQPRENVGQREIMSDKQCVFCPIAQNFLRSAPTKSVWFFGHNGLYL